MKVIIFNDTQNFNGSLSLMNSQFKKNEKRFWDYKKYIPFLVQKIKSIDTLGDKEFQLVKTLFYEGKYSSNLINTLRWNCNQKIRELNMMIEREKRLLDYISQEKLSHTLRRKINVHVEEIKNQLEEEKQKCFSYVERQKRQFEGQKDLFENLKGNPLIEIKLMPLKQWGGEIHQKGVDVLLAVDLVHLAHVNAYDLAVILSGDTDLIEAVKLIKSLGKIAIIISYHTPGDPKMSNVSDLMNAGKFINLRDFTKQEIFEMSELRKEKSNEEYDDKTN